MVNKNKFAFFILLVLEMQRFKSVKACRPKTRQAKVNENSSTNSLEGLLIKKISLIKNLKSVLHWIGKVLIIRNYCIRRCCYGVFWMI
ncbi:MAG: hypothetical protein LBP59_13970 [Planctomycetaceae bacterium]|nr:hypothetical protein [Planctomycetaceae bacterium]